VNDVKKIELIGVQDEKIYIDVSPARLAAMGLVPTQVFDALQRQNAVVPAGQVETETDRVRLRVTGPSTASRPCARPALPSAAAVSASATSPASRAAWPIRRSRACASPGAMRSGSASSWRAAAT
jgi:multidrug efflux pump subunit AcrB